MIKIASMNLDVVDHVLNEAVDTIAEIAESLSKEAKLARIPSFEEQHELDSTDVALVLTHPSKGEIYKYARYNKGLVELNLAFLDNLKEELPEEILKVAGANLTCAAKEFNVNVPKGLEKYKSDKYVNNVVDMLAIDKIAYEVKRSAVKEEDITAYAWEKKQKFPIHNKENIKAASEYFNKNHYSMEPDEKMEFAFNLEKAANLQKVEFTDPTFEKYASLNTSKLNADFEKHVAVRKTYMKDDNEDLGEAYDSLLEKAADGKPVEIAIAMGKLDKLAKITKVYGDGIEDPLMATLEIPKIASITYNGTIVTLEKLAKLAIDDLAPIVGNGYVSELQSEEGLDVFGSLPTPIKHEVIKLL